LQNIKNQLNIDIYKYFFIFFEKSCWKSGVLWWKFIIFAKDSGKARKKRPNPVERDVRERFC